jgi:hypothetical protein
MLTTLACVLPLAMPQGPQFHPPVRITVDGAPIRLEEPGYACPTLFDVDRDGKQDLVVGQFKDGKIRVHKGTGQGRFAAGDWLMAEGAIAEVPGVW